MTQGGPERSAQLVLGRYRVVRRLAQGGMGVVYLGRLEGAAGFAKPVVIKRILADPEDQPGSLARFIREAQILSNLQHPGIVGVLDFGEEEEEGYAMVLEYVHGYDLGRWLKYLQLKASLMHWEEAVFVVLRVLEALAYAHDFQRGDGSSAAVLHRDISPGNVLIDVEGRVRLVDFGIARMAATTGDQFKTETGVLKGKLAFLAPELFAGSEPTPASDIYACAVVLYQMLAGANPFTSHNDSRVMWRVIMEGPKPLGRQRDGLPQRLEDQLFIALAKDPARRHPSAEHLSRALRSLLTRPEAEIGAQLRERVRADFNGDMPTLLRLEPLGERDRAWRQDTPNGSGLGREGVGLTHPSVAPSMTPETLSHERARAQRQEEVTTRASGPAAPVELHPRELGGAARSSRRSVSFRSLLGLGAAMSVVFGLIIAATLLYLHRPPPPGGAARFIVVEASDPGAAGRRSAPSPAPHPAPSSERPPAPPVTEPAAGGRAGRTPAAERERERPTRKPADASAALSRSFARREGALGECFERNAAEVEGQPEISIEFEVAPSGKVNEAVVVPRALNGTPLGRCLGGVARATDFGPLPRLTRFSIPIRARAVRRD